MPAYKPATIMAAGSVDLDVCSDERSPTLAPGKRANTPSICDGVDAEVVDELHSLCGVYTRPELVKRLLDRVGWVSDVDLSSSRLLEPAVGDGAFLVEAAKRLVGSFVRRRCQLTIKSLGDRILAFEIVPREAQTARKRVISELTHLGVHHSTARACARAWVKNEDFLLSAVKNVEFTHIVGNPPYVRWSKIPDKIKAIYREKLPRTVARGDLYLPFLQRSFEALAPHGRCVFVCSDRWRYTAYAEEFRARWCSELAIDAQPLDAPKEAFDRNVNVQAEVLTVVRSERRRARRVKRRAPGVTLRDLGCTIRVGPALGVTDAFVLDTDEDDVEHELTHAWIHSREVLSGSIQRTGRRVISPYDDSGNLIDLSDYPMFEARIRRFEERLRSRYIVRMGAPWYSTIEKVQPLKWSAPKLLVPDVAKSPRIAVDRSGSVPSHGIYAIFQCDNEISEIYDRLKDGKLSEILSATAPMLRGGYRRCYRTFLDRIQL